MSQAGATSDELGPLPPGWKTKVDPKKNRRFYYNRERDITSWHRPKFEVRYLPLPHFSPTPPPPSLSVSLTDGRGTRTGGAGGAGATASATAGATAGTTAGATTGATAGWAE